MSTYPHPEDLLVDAATAETGDVLINVADERVAQVEKWGVQSWPDGTGADVYAEAARLAKERTDAAAEDGSLTWLDILFEEVFEAMAEADPARLREELVQVGAVAVAWVEDIDRKAERREEMNQARLDANADAEREAR